MTLYGINEARPGPRWKALFDAVWPGYRSWYLSPGSRPSLAYAESRLREHMPELVPTWQALAALADDDLAATMLTLWDPPKFLPGCSQAVLVDPDPVLIRNYDYGPELFESTVYSSDFVQPVIGTGDCLWGLLDGMNEAGLVVSLTFGGRPGSAPGFAAPLIVRYVLEVADSVRQAKVVLDRLPSAMAYNLTLVDTSGEVTTAFLAPGQSPEYSTSPVATNHRGHTPDNPAHAARFKSVERQHLLLSALDAGPSERELITRFLHAPLYSNDFDGAFGTLYTAIYRPAQRTVEYRWPHDHWMRSFDSPDELKTVTLGSEAGAGAAQSEAAPDAVAALEPASVGPGEISELGQRARQAIIELSRVPDQAAFGELLGLSEAVGVALGESARVLADHGSWSTVAGVAGVSRQAAWYRWRE